MQKSTCLACGIEKDMNVKEMYPYPDDSIDTEEPVQPLFEGFECQSDTDHRDFRLVTVCHKCWHRVQPNMWMSQGEWESLNPIINFNDLPKSTDNQDVPTDNKEVAMRKPIIIDCNKQGDGYCIRINPLSMRSFKPDVYRPSTVFLGFDYGKVPSLSILQWKILCRGLFNFKRIVPCIVKQVGKGVVYFRWPHKTVRSPRPQTNNT